MLCSAIWSSSPVLTPGLAASATRASVRATTSPAARIAANSAGVLTSLERLRSNFSTGGGSRRRAPGEARRRAYGGARRGRGPAHPGRPPARAPVDPGPELAGRRGPGPASEEPLVVTPQERAVDLVHRDEVHPDHDEHSRGAEG